MSHSPRRSAAHAALVLLVVAVALVATNARAQVPADKDKDEPPFHDYKGVRIGMTTDEARKKLGSPDDKSDKQDSYSFGDKESCQVYYDDTKKVIAVSIMYLGGNAVPVAKSVLGTDIESKQDGSASKLIRYPKAGYWVSYARMAGDSPMTIVTMQKIQ